MNETDALARYRSLPYKRKVEKVVDPKEGTYFICRYPDLPELAADGENRAEAIKNAEEAFDDYILARLHFGEPIPEPENGERVTRALELLEDELTSVVAVGIEFEEATISVAPDVLRRTLKSVLRKPEVATTRSEASSKIKQEAVAVAGQTSR